LNRPASRNLLASPTKSAPMSSKVLSGALRYPSDTGGWQLGDPDLGEYLDRYRDRRLVLIIAPVGDAEAAIYTCDICGFVYCERGGCPRCRLAIEEESEGLDGEEDIPDILDQVRELLRGADGNITPNAGD
jgi:hypothetical protein